VPPDDLSIRQHMIQNPDGRTCSRCGTFVDESEPHCTAVVCALCCHELASRPRKPGPKPAEDRRPRCIDCKKPIQDPHHRRKRCDKCQGRHTRQMARNRMRHARTTPQGGGVAR